MSAQARQMPRGDEAVAAVVPLAAKMTTRRERRPGISSASASAHAASGRFHQDETGDSVLPIARASTRLICSRCQDLHGDGDDRTLGRVFCYLRAPMPLRFLTAGESHGPALTTIVEGLPAGVPVVKAADRRGAESGAWAGTDAAAA